MKSKRIWTVFHPLGVETWRTEEMLLWRKRIGKGGRERRSKHSVWPDFLHHMGHHQDAVQMLHGRQQNEQK